MVCARRGSLCDRPLARLEVRRVGRGLVAPLGAATRVAVHPALLAKAGGCGTHAPLSFLHAWSTRTGPATGDANEVRQSSPKPRPCLRCSGASRGSKTVADTAPRKAAIAAAQFCKRPEAVVARSRKRSLAPITRSPCPRAVEAPAECSRRIGTLNASFHCLQLYGWPRKRSKARCLRKNSPLSMTIRILHRPESLYTDAG